MGGSARLSRGRVAMHLRLQFKFLLEWVIKQLFETNDIFLTLFIK